MIRNYLKIAIRNLQKQRVIAFINVFGLSVGIACFILLLLFSAYELSFDKFHKNAPSIYRPYVFDRSIDGKSPQEYTDWWAPTPMGETMKRNIPDVVDFVRLQLPWGENLLRSGNNVHRVSITFADQSFFSIFTFPLKYGNSASALLQTNDIVLTESRAKTLFGNDDVVGKTVEIQIGTAFYPFKVSAVAKDIPGNSTIRFDVLGNFGFALANKNRFFIGSSWHPTVWETYVQLRPGSKLADDPKRLASYFQAANPGFVAGLKNAGYKWIGNDLPVAFRLQPLLSIHTDTWFHGWSFTDYGIIDLKTIWILLAIAGGILLIACINFTTLAIGRSAGRSKEVGVRKVIGAERKQIVFQFLTESLLLSFISTLLGLIGANLLLPWFNNLSGGALHFSMLFNLRAILAMTALLLIVGLLAGSYPALVLSGFKPIEVLKNKIRIGGANLFTKSLVTFQFVLSIVLIISTIVILKQTRYLINKSPGFDKENILAIDAAQTDPNKTFPVFKQAVLNHPEILGITSAQAGLGAGQDLLGYSDKGLSAAINGVDADYIKVMGIKLIAGENFLPSQASDTTKRIIINETMMKAFGWNPQNAIGQEIPHFQGQNALVIGVVKNFNYRPLSEEVKNQVFELSPDKGSIHFYVRIKPGDPAKALAIMLKAWSSSMPGVPMKYSFLDEDVNSYYNAEQRWSSIVGIAGGISIFLGCLGLLGLAALAAINRIKEIGIRKVLGASVLNIARLLLTDFLKLIFIAFVIASPIAWYLMSKWLQDYANRINISWSVFLLAGVFAVLFALITISFQAIKTALMNPVKSLRTE
jgi:putative ABC transport system permease protein